MPRQATARPKSGNADIADAARDVPAPFTQDEYDRSLLRLYKELGRAESYRAIVSALRPEIARMLGYESVWLELLGLAGTPGARPD